MCPHLWVQYIEVYTPIFSVSICDFGCGRPFLRSIHPVSAFVFAILGVSDLFEVYTPIFFFMQKAKGSTEVDPFAVYVKLPLLVSLCKYFLFLCPNLSYALFHMDTAFHRNLRHMSVFRIKYNIGAFCKNIVLHNSRCLKEGNILFRIIRNLYRKP